MTVSTEKNQTVVGTGDLVKNWKSSGRNYYQYKADQIPFRFAVSSAAYVQKSILYKGIKINILYNEKHSENVNHLIENTKITLNYCRKNFGEYPFKPSISQRFLPSPKVLQQQLIRRLFLCLKIWSFMPIFMRIRSRM
jgi:hypothetical protein